MSTLREAAQQALEALEREIDTRRCKVSTLRAMNNLRAALAEPCPCGDRPAAKCPGEWEPGCDLGNNPKYAKRVEMTPKELAASIKRGEKWKVAEPVQEPVAWIQPDHLQKARKAPFLCRVEPTKRMVDFVPLYATPPQRKPLTDEEIDSIWDSEKAFVDIYAIVRTIERAHGIT